MSSLSADTTAYKRMPLDEVRAEMDEAESIVRRRLDATTLETLRPLNWEEVQQLHAEGHEIGGLPSTFGHALFDPVEFAGQRFQRLVDRGLVAILGRGHKHLHRDRPQARQKIEQAFEFLDPYRGAPGSVTRNQSWCRVPLLQIFDDRLRFIERYIAIDQRWHPATRAAPQMFFGSRNSNACSIFCRGRDPRARS